MSAVALARTGGAFNSAVSVSVAAVGRPFEGHRSHDHHRQVDFELALYLDTRVAQMAVNVGLLGAYVYNTPMCFGVFEHQGTHLKTIDLTGFTRSAGLVTLALIMTLAAGPAMAQDGGWTHWGGNAASTRYAPFDQIDARNFEDLEVAWVWRGDNFGPHVYNIQRSTPIYADGKRFSVAGERRTVLPWTPRPEPDAGSRGRPGGSEPDWPDGDGVGRPTPHR